MIHKTRIVTLSLAAGITTTVLVARAGDLSPPVGPVAPTHKTLTEVEPRIAVNETNTPHGQASLFKITQPGSYYLTGNITGVLGKHGIEIAVSNVTLDLNGFDLAGAPGMGAFDGVRCGTPFLTNIVVINGSVRDWGDEGLDFLAITASNCHIERLRASGNIGNGINAGPSTTLINCSADDNTGEGIFVAGGCTLTDCSIRSNSSRGVLLQGSGLIIGGIVSGNTTAGIEISGAVGNCTILKTKISDTTAGPGVSATIEGLRIESSSITSNSTFGIIVNTDSDIAELAVVNCTIRDNGSAGISSEASTQILDSLVSSNGGAGIILTGTGQIRGCNITSNIASGVELTGNANVVVNNTVSSNAPSIAAAAGILVQGTDNTVDGNRLFSNAQGGIKVNAGGNLVLRNYLARTGATIIAVAGNAVAQTIASPGAGFVSTDPNANYTY